MTSGLQRIGKRFTSKKNAGDQLSFGPKLPLQFLIKLRNLTQWEGLKEGVARECVVSGTARNGKVARGAWHTRSGDRGPSNRHISRSGWRERGNLALRAPS